MSEERALSLLVEFSYLIEMRLQQKDSNDAFTIHGMIMEPIQDGSNFEVICRGQFDRMEFPIELELDRILELFVIPEDKDGKVWKYLNTRVENNRSFDIIVSDIAKELNLTSREIIDSLRKFQDEGKLRISDGQVARQAFHQFNYFGSITVLGIDGLLLNNLRLRL